MTEVAAVPSDVRGTSSKETRKGKVFVYGKGTFRPNPNSSQKTAGSMAQYEFPLALALEYAKLCAEKDAGQPYHILRTTEVFLSKVTVEPPAAVPFTFDNA